MKECIPIYTHYKDEPERRGTYIFKERKFYRPRCPLLKNWHKRELIALEIDLIGRLEQLSCLFLSFAIRKEYIFYGGMDVIITLEEFKKYAVIKDIGVPDRRKQYVFNLRQHFERLNKKKEDAKQTRLF